MTIGEGRRRDQKEATHKIHKAIEVLLCEGTELAAIFIDYHIPNAVTFEDSLKSLWDATQDVIPNHRGEEG